MAPGCKKSLYVAPERPQLSFHKVAQITLTGVLFDLSDCVLCWTDDLWRDWLDQLGEPSNGAKFDRLDVLNANQLTLPEWETRLAGQAYDLVVMHGVQAAHRAEQLSDDYAAALIDATPAELIMWA